MLNLISGNNPLHYIESSMIKINKNNKKAIINFLSLNVIWISTTYFWDFIFEQKNQSDRYVNEMILDNIQGLNLFLAGIILGTTFSLMNLYIKKRQNRLRKKSYGGIIIFYSITHIILTIISIFCIGIISQYIIHGTIEKETILEIRKFVRSEDFIRILIFTYIVSVGIILFQIINRKFGPGVLVDLLMGKYRQPKEANMIFLFIDLKSSTTYAERLGHVRYSSLIQDCFTHLTKAVTENDATIYQYIGDEVVLIWPYQDGIKKARCIKMFYRFKEILQENADYYLNTYGFIPQFKAGINGGKLMAAEVGVVKRSIAYHGDVINTASRIQGLCSSFSEEFLASKLIVNELKNEKQFQFRFIENIQLKGKKEKVNIYAINQYKHTYN